MNKTICNKRVKRLSLMFAKSVTVVQALFFSGKREFRLETEERTRVCNLRSRVIRPPFQPSLVYE